MSDRERERASDTAAIACQPNGTSNRAASNRLFILELAGSLDLCVAIFAISRGHKIIAVDAPINVVLQKNLCHMYEYNHNTSKDVPLTHYQQQQQHQQ
jgi:hypothetical protein